MTAGTVIAQDRACVHCGYNLHGLNPEDKCPECFTAIALSLRGNLLRDADAEWLDRLRFGALLKLWSIGITILLAGLALILVIKGLPQNLLIIVALIISLLGFWAAFAITTQEPRISLQEDPVTWRKIIRLCALLTLIGSPLEHVGQTGQYAQALIVTGKVLQLAGLLGWFGELLYFRRFAWRIPDPKLARSTGIVMWGGTVTLVCMIVLGAVLVLLTGVTAAAAPPAAAPPAAAPAAAPQAGLGITLAGGGLCVVAVPALVFYLWYIVLLVSYKNAFEKAATQARGIEQPGSTVVLDQSATSTDSCES